ncbi:MAG: hypothetical protein AAF488_03390, partial [Planctomycetota bacterium]
MQKTILVPLLLALVASVPVTALGTAQAQKPTTRKSPLSVLFVGHDPENPLVEYQPTERTVALHQERTPAFESFLREHFEQVRVVYAADYRVSMSDESDVTVFDARPPVLVAADRKSRVY